MSITEERIKRGIEYLTSKQYVVYDDYLECNDDSRILFKMWHDFDWRESAFDKGNEIYHYRCWKANGGDFRLMNIIIYK